MQTIKHKLLDIFCSSLNVEFSVENSSKIVKEDLQEWDSIANVILYQRITSEIGVDLHTNEFLMCESFNDIVRLVTDAS